MKKRRQPKMDGKSKQEIESAVSEVMAKFLKEQMAEQAEQVVTQVVGDTIIVRFKGILPPAERHMVRNQEGERLIKELKGKLMEKAKPLLETLVENLTKAQVIDIHSSFDAEEDELIEIFILNKDLEKAYQV